MKRLLFSGRQQLCLRVQLLLCHPLLLLLLLQTLSQRWRACWARGRVHSSSSHRFSSSSSNRLSSSSSNHISSSRGSLPHQQLGLQPGPQQLQQQLQ
jgi:hypothetical protein